MLQLLKVSLLVVIILFYVPADAQTAKADSTQTDSTITAGDAVKPPPDSVTSFEQLEMPPEMQMEFDRLSPKGVVSFHDEFQGMHDGFYGQAIRTIKVWYIDDHIIGYSIEKPFDPGPGGSSATRKQKINIPVTWCCIPTTEGHAEHCVNTLAALKGADTTYKCSGWHLKIPDAYNEMLEQHTQKLKKIKPQPKTGDFGHAPKTDNKATRKKNKNQKGFDGYNDQPAATDSTQQKPAKDSIP